MPLRVYAWDASADADGRQHSASPDSEQHDQSSVVLHFAASNQTVARCASLRSKQQDRRRLFFTSQQAGKQSSLVHLPLHSVASASARYVYWPMNTGSQQSRASVVANVLATHRHKGTCTVHTARRRCAPTSPPKSPHTHATPPLQMSHKCQCTVLLLIKRLHGPSLPFFFSASLVPHELAAADAPCIHNTNACHTFTL